MKEKVQRQILEKSTHDNSTPKISLCMTDFIAFLKEVQDDYKQMYGGFICDERSSAEGEANILFHGCPIVLDLKAEPLP